MLENLHIYTNRFVTITFSIMTTYCTVTCFPSNTLLTFLLRHRTIIWSFLGEIKKFYGRRLFLCMRRRKRIILWPTSVVRFPVELVCQRVLVVVTAICVKDSETLSLSADYLVTLPCSLPWRPTRTGLRLSRNAKSGQKTRRCVQMLPVGSSRWNWKSWSRKFINSVFLVIVLPIPVSLNFRREVFLTLTLVSIYISIYIYLTRIHGLTFC